MRLRPALLQRAGGPPLLALLLLFLAHLQGPAPCAAQQRDFYVSPAGDDTGPGSLFVPWRTIDRVNGESFRAGDRIHFEGGETFAGTLRFGADDTGSPTNPIVVDSYGLERAVIDAGTGTGIDVYNTAGIEIRDLVVRGGWDADLQTGNVGSGISFYVDLAGTTPRARPDRRSGGLGLPRLGHRHRRLAGGREHERLPGRGDHGL